LLNATSATGVTLVVTGGVTLFVPFGSPVGEPTLAVLVSVPLAGVVTVNVRLVTWLFVNVPKLHVTTPSLVAKPPLAPAKVTPAGSASVTNTLLALDGPKLVTEIV
jgi:hypothetical protein